MYRRLPVAVSTWMKSTVRRYVYAFVLVISLVSFFRWLEYVVDGDPSPHWMNAPRG